MYGLLCESHDFIKESYRDDVWKLVRESRCQVYIESFIPRIAKAACGVTGTPHKELMNSSGVCFLGFVEKYGYDRILECLSIQVLCRHIRDFVNGLDNFHEYLLPQGAASDLLLPGGGGLTAAQMWKQFYDTDIHVEVLSEQMIGDYSHVTMRSENFPITSDFFFEVFPFNRQDMVVQNVGSSLATVFPDLDGKKFNDTFLVARPLVEFTRNMIISNPKNLFQIISKQPAKREDPSKQDWKLVNNSDYENLSCSAGVHVEIMAYQSVIGDDYKGGNSANATESWGDGSCCLKLKGQMRYMPEWESIIFLGTPSLNAVFKTGLYISDLRLHDSSRDLEQKQSSKLEERMKLLDYEMKKTEDLLYRMMQKRELAGFTRICSHITLRQVVSMLNTIYTLFDTLSVTQHIFNFFLSYLQWRCRHGSCCDMALDMVHSLDHLKDPSNSKNIPIFELQIQRSSASYKHLKGSHLMSERRGIVSIKAQRDKHCNAQAACPQFETRTISKAISKATVLDPEATGDEQEPVFPLVPGEDEDDVKYVRSHRMKMEISGHFLGTWWRKSHYNDGLQDSHLDWDSRGSEDRDDTVVPAPPKVPCAQYHES
ncbi:tubulin polyglutamylase TTLL1 [Sarotherodon galilaeus]